MASGRLLFIDLLRIVGISLVVISHLYYLGGRDYFPWLYFSFQYPQRPVFHIDVGSIGVWMFIFASGASLAFRRYSFDSLKSVGRFYGNRLLRIYPIYWVAVIFSTMIMPVTSALTLSDYVRWFSGFQIFFITDNSWEKINSSYWFIGLIICLYFLFPIIYSAMNRHPHVSLLSLFLINAVSSVIVWNYSRFVGVTDWFPLCQIFDFGLGIYLVQRWSGLRMWKFTSGRTIAFASELVFYVYLVHGPLMQFIPPVFFEFGYGYALTWFVVGVLLFGCMFYAFDKQIHKVLSKLLRA
jgi:peptidoglycan/LPS O-acetylase OafA/YrhL